MKKHNTTIIALAALAFLIPTLHAAASSSSCGPLVASSSTDSSASQKVNTVFALIGNDAKIISDEAPTIFKINSSKIAFINTETASKYSSLLDHMAHTILPALASESTALDIAEQHIDVDAPGDLLLALTTIMHRAHEQERYKNMISAFELSENPSVISQMDTVDVEGYRKLFDLARTYEIKQIITDVIAIFTLQRFYGKPGTFNELVIEIERAFTPRHKYIQQLRSFIKFFNNPHEPSSIEPALEKQLFLSSLKCVMDFHRFNVHSYRSFSISIQDLFDFKILTQSTLLTSRPRGKKTAILSFYPINDITGIKILQYIGFKRLMLNNNGITAIPAYAFAGFTELEELYLDYNQIIDIASDAFAGLINLRWLNLRNNLIDLADRARIEAEVKVIAPKAKICW